MAYTTIDDPEEYFNTVVFTGDVVDGDGTYHDQAVTGVGFQPDLLWHKGVTGARPHYIVDSVRGQGGSPTEMKHISSSATAEETTTNTNGHIKSLDSDGWTAVSGSDSSSRANNSCLNGEKYVGWCWKEDATAGFDIVSWTVPASGSTTISHSLSAVPKMIISKCTDTDNTDWETYHNGIGNANTIQLNTTAASGDNNAYNDTDPTSSVFSITTAGFGANRAIISYLFAEVKGYSKFGKYTGNGQTDGPYVFTGFRPAFCLIKRSDATASWVLIDNKRSTSSNGNPVDKYFNNNTTDTETTGTTYTKFDFCANGIKVTEDNTDINASGGTYLYIAFAEAPLVNSEGIPGNAR